MSEGTQPPAENAVETKPEGDAAAPAAPPQKEMKSVVLTGFGGVKMVKVLQKPEPTAKEGEVLVRVKAW